jgi:spore coat protein U-like protein
MKKLVLSVAAAAVMALPTFAQAQNATLSATAVVSTLRTVDNKQDLNFGTFAPGAAVVVDPTSAGATRGQIKLTTNANTLVTVSGGILNHGTANTGTIEPTYTCASAPDLSGVPGTATPFVCDVPTTINALLAPESRWILVGGAIAVTESNNKPAGTYTGTITVTAASVS